MIETGVDAGFDREAHPRKVTAGALGGAERGRRPRKAPRRLRRDQDHKARAGAHGRLGGRARERHRLDRALRLGDQGDAARGAARRTGAGGGGAGGRGTGAETDGGGAGRRRGASRGRGEPVEAEEPVAVEEPVAEQPAAVTVESDALTVEPEPSAVEVPPARKRRGFWGWLFRTRTGGAEVEEPEPVAIEPEPGAGASEEPEPVAVEPEPEPVAVEPEPEPVAVEPEPEPVAVEPEVEPEPEPSRGRAGRRRVEAQPEAVDPERARAILDEALDALGAAHHRPFSRG